MESNFCRLDIVREIPLLELNFCVYLFLEDLGGTFLPKLIYLQRKDLDLQNLQYCFAKVLKLKSLNIVAIMQHFFKKHEDHYVRTYITKRAYFSALCDSQQFKLLKIA